MCWLCTKHGAGKRYYKNVKLYSDELYNDPELGIAASLQASYTGGATQGSWYNYSGWMRDEAFLPARSQDPETRSAARQNMDSSYRGVYCQVIAPEEQHEVLKIASEPIGRMSCVCRRVWLAEADHKVCYMFGAHLTDFMAPKNPSYTYGVEMMSREEAIEHSDTLAAKGYVATLWNATSNVYIYAICHCEMKNCQSFPWRLDYGASGTLKGHKVAMVDINKCIPSRCNRDCAVRCQVGAIKISPTLGGQARINFRRCYGCGVCAINCPEGAIELLERESMPVLEDYGW